jgi:hypothetical protein
LWVSLLQHVGTLKKRGARQHVVDDLETKRAKAKEKPYKLGDSGGLFLWATPSGGKLWRWSYRHDGKQKLMTLGKYPDVSLALQIRRNHSQANWRITTPGFGAWH